MPTPRYVYSCECQLWHLQLWNSEDPQKTFRVPFRCRSWRHTGDCSWWKGAQDWCRVKEALETFKTWSVITLTFDPRDWWEWTDQYKYSVHCWASLQKRMIRKYGKLKYIQTWERHKIQGIHVNLCVHNDKIFDLVTKDRWKWRREWLEPNAVDCKFGMRTFVEPMRSGSSSSMAGYLVKLSRELVGANSKGQIPYDAPKNFRRLRASAKTLPAIIKSEMKGVLHQFPMPSRPEKQS